MSRFPFYFVLVVLYSNIESTLAAQIGLGTSDPNLSLKKRPADSPRSAG
jgi:hypothetical protein